MESVVVLGGYGRLGRLCAHELAGHSNASLVIAGRNVQRAESLALSFGARGRGAYADARDPRSLARSCEGASAIVHCAGGDPRAALSVSLELRVPLISASPVELEPGQRRQLAELAWQAQVPILLYAGAVPGLPGLVAEALMRRLPQVEELRIASTGPYAETETAQNELRTRGVGTQPLTRRRFVLPKRFSFPEPIGLRLMTPARSPELDGFAESHVVGRLDYLEPSPGRVGRALHRIVSHRPRAGFAVSALALDPGLDARIDVVAQSPLLAAAALLWVLVGALLEKRVPAGLSTPHEALPPAQTLLELEKRGLWLRFSA